MINNLSLPFPDEIFYNWFGRYHYLSGNLKVTSTLIDLLDLVGCRASDISISYPVNLNFLCSEIPALFNISPGKIIKNNTIFPFFQPFLPENIIDLVLKGMKEKTVFHLNDMTGVNSDRLFNNNIVKICKQCVNDDTLNVGEGYIHTTHQIPGCFICNRHHIPLEYVDLTQTKYQNEFFTLNDILDEARPFKIDNKIFDSLLQLTSDIIYLTSENLNNFDLVKVRNNYNEQLIIKGYSTTNGTINQKKLQNDFLDFYSKEYLIYLYSCITAETQNNWLHYISKNRIEKIHPIKHLLFIRFLFGGINKFVGFNEKYKPFGKAPWPCLNILCKHYKQDTIEAYELIESRYTNRIGRFKCSKCGFTYTRRGPDIEKNDRYKIRTVEEYGDAWGEKLTDLLINYNYCVETLRKKLKCGAGQIVSYVSSHNLLQYLTINDQIKIQNTPNAPTKGILVHQYKKTILQYIKNNKKATRKEICTALNKECALVTYSDYEWYKKTLPTPLKKELNCQGKGDLVNWEIRDLELSKKVIEAIHQIKETTTSRITKKQISYITNSSYITKSKYISKLPITQKIINNSFETNDEYLKRKADYIIKDLFNKGQTITAKQLRSILYITIRKNGDLNNYINEALSKYTSM